MSKQTIVIDVLPSPDGLRVNVAAESWLTSEAAGVIATVAAVTYGRQFQERETRLLDTLPAAAFADGTVIEYHYAEPAPQKGD